MSCEMTKNLPRLVNAKPMGSVPHEATNKEGQQKRKLL